MEIPDYDRRHNSATPLAVETVRRVRETDDLAEAVKILNDYPASAWEVYTGFLSVIRAFTTLLDASGSRISTDDVLNMVELTVRREMGS